MSYASRVGFCDEVAINSGMLSECAGPAVELGLEDGLGLADELGVGSGLRFCGSLTIAGGGVVISTFSFSKGSLVSLGKPGIFGSLSGEAAMPVMSLPFTRRSRLPELATWIHVSGRALSACTEAEKTASRDAFSAVIHLPDGGSRSKSGFLSTHVMWTGCSMIVARRAFGQTCSCTRGETHSSVPCTMPVLGVTLHCSSEINEPVFPPGSLKPPQTRSCAEPG